MICRWRYGVKAAYYIDGVLCSSSFNIMIILYNRVLINVEKMKSKRDGGQYAKNKTKGGI